MLGSGQRVSCFDFPGGQLSQNHSSFPIRAPGGDKRGCVCTCVCARARVCVSCAVLPGWPAPEDAPCLLLYMWGWFKGPESL